MEMQQSGGEPVGIEYWLKWQVPVCALIMLIPAAVAIKLITISSSASNNNDNDNDNDNDNRLWVPCWRGLNPVWLLAYRAFAFITMAYLLYHMLLFAGLFAFYFYTQWTFALVMLYFAIGTVISARGCFMSSHKLQSGSKHTDTDTDTDTLQTSLQGNNVSNSVGEAKQAAPTPFLGSAFVAIYHTSAGASILTDLVFWCILMPLMLGKQFQLTLVIACIHSLNAVFLIIDSLLNALPFRWFGFNYFMLWTVTYAVFQWILHACGFTWWPYPFLELSTPWAPLWYFGIALVHVPCYGLYILIVKAKNSILSKLFPRVFIRSDGEISDHHSKTA